MSASSLIFLFPFVADCIFLSPTVTLHHPLPSSPLNYHCISTSHPPPLTAVPFLFYPPPHRADRPPIPPCRIITTSPPAPTSAPCTSPTRGADEGATTASSRRRPCSQTGPGPSTSTSTSQTGSPPPTMPARTLFQILFFGPHPEFEWRREK